jgi:hypothetical protein
MAMCSMLTGPPICVWPRLRNNPLFKIAATKVLPIDMPFERRCSVQVVMLKFPALSSEAGRDPDHSDL